MDRVFRVVVGGCPRRLLGDRTAATRMGEVACLVCGQACVNASAFTSAHEIVEALIGAATIARQHSYAAAASAQGF